MLFCPDDSVALIDVPAGYEIGLEAWRSGALVERTEASTSVGDNFRLYVREVFKRNPRSRSTGTVTGNMAAGFRDSGGDLADAFRYGVTGTHRSSIHTGETGYRASPVTMVPRALRAVILGSPLLALNEIFTGVDSTIQMAASTVSAVHNAAINPALQATVGNVASPEAADTGSEYLGAFTQAAVKNLPFGERSLDAVSPIALVRHDRAFATRDYTRTDTQLNIDRVMTAADIGVIRAIRHHNDSSSSQGASEDTGGDDPPAPQGDGGGGGGGGLPDMGGGDGGLPDMGGGDGGKHVKQLHHRFRHHRHHGHRAHHGHMKPGHTRKSLSHGAKKAYGALKSLFRR